MFDFRTKTKVMEQTLKAGEICPLIFTRNSSRSGLAVITTIAANTGPKTLCRWLSRTYVLLLYPTKQMVIPFAITSAAKFGSLSSLCRSDICRSHEQSDENTCIRTISSIRVACDIYEGRNQKVEVPIGRVAICSSRWRGGFVTFLSRFVQACLMESVEAVKPDSICDQTFWEFSIVAN